MKVYKVGDIVDIRGNGAVQKGMPHKVYHGKTGRVFNVTAHALGVIVNKRQVPRGLLKRQGERRLLTEARAANKKVNLKRQPAPPKPAHIVSGSEAPVLLAPIPYEFVA
ncbi:ribosomal protein l21e domain-containing protein [Phthorimaea operculella]|nr:ribosomal protein l21e domain-containing protein [Phthorimaea operculella]